MRSATVVLLLLALAACDGAPEAEQNNSTAAAAPKREENGSGGDLTDGSADGNSQAAAERERPARWEVQMRYPEGTGEAAFRMHYNHCLRYPSCKLSSMDLRRHSRIPSVDGEATFTMANQLAACFVDYVESNGAQLRAVTYAPATEHEPNSVGMVDKVSEGTPQSCDSRAADFDVTASGALHRHYTEVTVRYLDSRGLLTRILDALGMSASAAAGLIVILTFVAPVAALGFILWLGRKLLRSKSRERDVAESQPQE